MSSALIDWVQVPHIQMASSQLQGDRVKIRFSGVESSLLVEVSAMIGISIDGEYTFRDRSRSCVRR